VLASVERCYAEALREQAAAVLATLGLRLAAEKNRVVHIDEGFDFLSFAIRKMRKRGTTKHNAQVTVTSGPRAAAVSSWSRSTGRTGPAPSGRCR
jgi:hypothetical protein